MNLTELEARHREELGRLDGILISMGYTTQMLEKSECIPYPALLATPSAQRMNPPLQMVLTFYPVDAEEIKHSLLLQYYLELPITVDEAALRRVGEALPELNQKAVLGHFGINEGRPTLHYRYVQALPAAAPITREAVADVITLVNYTPLLFMEQLKAIANGKSTTP